MSGSSIPVTWTFVWETLLGVDFSDSALTEDSLTKACRGILNLGTTAFLATVVTSPLEVYERNLPLIASIMQRPEFKHRLLGIHLEGPLHPHPPGTANGCWPRTPLA